MRSFSGCLYCVSIDSCSNRLQVSISSISSTLSLNVRKLDVHTSCCMRRCCDTVRSTHHFGRTQMPSNKLLVSCIVSSLDLHVYRLAEIMQQPLLTEVCLHGSIDRLMNLVTHLS